MPAGVFGGDAGRLLVTYLGLVAASILPSVTLLQNSMSKSVGSVKAINDLNVEPTASIDALMLLMGLSGLSVIALVALAIPTPAFVFSLAHAPEALERVGQFIVGGAATLTLLRVGQVPAILRHSLAVRHRIAVEESRKATSERAPGPVEVKSAFPTSEGFGRTVNIADLRAAQPDDGRPG